MFDAGDQLLFALSAWGEAPRTRYIQAFDELFLEGTTGDSYPDVALERWRALAILAALGHVEQVRNGTDSVVIAPAALVRLPAPGLARAILCGRRAPSAINEVRLAARQVGSISVQIQSQVRKSRYAPARIEATASDEGVLSALAHELELRYLAIPSAWSIADLSGSLESRMAALKWLDEPDLNWVRRDFSPTLLRFVPPRVAALSEEEPRLSRYTNPMTNTSIVRLWRNGRSAEIDANFGRFEVLRQAGRRVLTYDERRFVFGEPWGAPLPPLLARALTLCTGEVARDADSVPRQTGGYHEYAGVPPDVALSVLEKTGQAAL